MKKVFFVFLVSLFLFGCGKKSAPTHKSDNQINNIIIIL